MGEITDWLNSNQGILSLFIFLATLIIGWVTGIFRALMKRPKFKIRVIKKMTFGTAFLTGEKYTPPGHGTYDLHKTAFVIYLEITNVGSAASSLGKIKIGYYKDDGKSTLFQKRLWINQSNILDVFAIPLGDGQFLSIPNLNQGSVNIDDPNRGFLLVGESIAGAAYFEQVFSWGNNYPRMDEKAYTNIKIKIYDAFGRRYSKKENVLMKPLTEAVRYNPKFGFTEHLFDKDKIKELETKTDKENEGGIK
jgi:hypothetical protein